MSHKNKIILKKPRFKFLLLFLGYLIFIIAGVLMISEPTNRLMGYIVAIFFGVGAIISISNFLKPQPFAIINEVGIEMNLSKKGKFIIPWKEIKKIGVQFKFRPSDNNTIIEEGIFLVFSLKNADKYKFKFDSNDYELFSKPEFFNVYFGEKADIYILLTPWMNDKKIEELIESLRKKPFINFAKFPPLIKTNNKNEYEKMLSEEWKSKKLNL